MSGFGCLNRRAAGIIKSTFLLHYTLWYSKWSLLVWWLYWPSDIRVNLGIDIIINWIINHFNIQWLGIRQYVILWHDQLRLCLCICHWIHLGMPWNLQRRPLEIEAFHQVIEVQLLVVIQILRVDGPIFVSFDEAHTIVKFILVPHGSLLKESLPGSKLMLRLLL